MQKRIFNGIFGIVLTPFKDNGKVDYDTLEKQLSKAVGNDSLDGLVVCGSTGEFSRMGFEENTRVMKVASDVNKKKKQLVCGATSGDSYTTDRYVEYISSLGADGALIAPPYYFKLSDDEIFEFYRDVFVNNSAKLPIVGYNIPQCTCPVSVKVFDKLLEFESFKGFKNSWNDMQEITSEIALRDEKRPDVSMLTGLDACLYGTYALGGDGIFSAISYLMPEIMSFIKNNYGKNENAFKCQCDLIKLINVVNRFTFPLGYRILSDAVGNNLGIGREIVPTSFANDILGAKKEMYEIHKSMMNNYN